MVSCYLVVNHGNSGRAKIFFASCCFRYASLSFSSTVEKLPRGPVYKVAPVHPIITVIVPKQRTNKLDNSFRTMVALLTGGIPPVRSFTMQATTAALHGGAKYNTVFLSKKHKNY
jgi:hypothetical protein